MDEENYNDLIRKEEEWDQQEDQMPPFSAPSMFQQEDNENLVKWQLDIKDELVRIEHLLRKHIPKTDKNGDVYYIEPEEKDKLFNERGVNEILNLLAWYLNKNIILSNFSEEDINQRCKQFALFLKDFIFNNYQNFGLDNKDKIKHYPMVVMNVVNTVEAAYNRALNGGERESLRTARHVMQNEPLNAYGQGMAQQPRSFSLFKPTTWIKR